MNQISLGEYRQQIERAIEQERYTEAVAHGRHILEQYPKCVQAYWLLGKAMLEAGQNEHATNMLQRVLSIDPEHMLAWVGLGEVAKRQRELETAAWYLERAFELATDNEMVAEELRDLYGTIEGRKPERLQLTQGALARLYLRGDLLSRAITELRKLLAEHPDRVDLKVALAEALWRSGQRLQAAEVSQEILDEQPHNLKASLILGQIWTDSGREEGESYLERAEAIDPENDVAQQLFGTATPLPPQEPQITPLDYEAAVKEEGRFAWMVDSVELPPARETGLARPEDMITTKIEIPEWLQEAAGEAPPQVPAPAEAAQEESVEEELTTPPEEDVEEGAALEGEGAEAVPEEDVLEEDTLERDTLEWLSELEGDEDDLYGLQEEAPAFEPQDELPAWLADLEAEPPGEEAALEVEEAEEEAGREEPEPAEIPEWLRGLAPASEDTSEVPPPDDLAALLEEEIPEAEAPEDVPDLPDWLESEDMPSGDDALAWLEQLTEGKEEELLARAEAESEARMAEILGRPEEIVEELEEPGEKPPAEEPAVQPEEPGAPEEAPLEELELKGELPAWLESEDMPSGDEALAWLEQLTEGKEEELLARAEAESEARMAEILERPEEIEEEPEEEEAFGWTAFGEAAPAEELERAEEAPAVEEPEEWVPSERAEAEPTEETEAIAEEEAFGWTAFGEEEVPPVAGEVAPAEEAVPAETLEPAIAEEEAEEPAAAEAEVTEAPEADEEVPSVAAEELVPAAAIEEVPTEDLGQYISRQRSYAEEHPDDPEAWLELGRVLWQADRGEEAIQAYDHLIRCGRLLDEIIPDLEDYAEQSSDPGVQQALGDAYARTDRLQDALDVYRRALASL